MDNIENIIYEHTTDAGEAGLAIDSVEDLARAIKNQVIKRAIDRLKNITISPESDDWWVQNDINAVVRELEES